MSGFRGKIFEIPITRSIEVEDLSWPSAEERRSETLGGNRGYSSLGRATWSEVREFVAAESEIMDRISKAGDWEACFHDCLEEYEEESFLYGFDLGTNALSAALAAARCLPFYSCNGGSFNEGHNDTYPLVAFFCRPALFPHIMTASEKSQTGLEYNRAGGLTAFAREVGALVDMAAALFDMRADIDAVRIRRSTKGARTSRGQQGEFF
jgi:hypothetical protein